MKIDIIAGARPNFIKISPIINQIKLKENFFKISYRLIHTGQHYDDDMSSNFFKQLNIPPPDINLNVGSSSHAKQTGDIMLRYEEVLNEEKPDICLVVGDVNSTMACSIVAKKYNLKVAHVEAGIRSFDLTMPEEINRMVTDSITDYFFTTSEFANENLINAGIKKDKIHFVGNVMIDTLKNQIENFIKPDFFDNYKLSKKKYFVLTMHRPSNVDDKKKLIKLLDLIDSNTKNYPILFPVHPRTKSILSKNRINFKNIIEVCPMTYLEFNYLVKNSSCVITDSGGITEETTVMNIPCITLRNNTERPETIKYGTNLLVGHNSKKIINALNKVLENKWHKGKIPKYWDGNSASRIVKILLSLNEK
tara:strand:+ start:283 stop:1374 length:1092 start_codon:yes stop_codon:yes gene_type:complete